MIQSIRENRHGQTSALPDHKNAMPVYRENRSRFSWSGVADIPFGHVCYTGVIGLFSLFFFVWSLFCFPSQAVASDRMQSRIRVIHADSGPPHIDPSLKDLAQELQSVFKYTAYQLVSAKSLSLSTNHPEAVPLPGGRDLELIYKGMENGRIQLAIRILKKRRQVFTTNVLLKNHGSITIGGPRFETGYLLFNISGNVR